MDSLEDVIAALAAADFKGAGKVAREQLVPRFGAGFFPRRVSRDGPRHARAQIVPNVSPVDIRSVVYIPSRRPKLKNRVSGRMPTSAAWDGAPELWAVPASAGEFPIEAARFTGLDLRGYQQMRLVLNVGGQAGLTGTILYYRYSLDGGATWYDTDAAIQLDGSTNQAFWGNWQPIPPMLRQSIDTTVALFGRDGDGSTVVELVDWFTLDVRGIDLTSAARLLPSQVTPAEIADPIETELRSFSPKDIADIVAAVLAS